VQIKIIASYVGTLIWFYLQCNRGDEFSRHRESGFNDFFNFIINGDHFRLIRGGRYRK